MLDTVLRMFIVGVQCCEVFTAILCTCALAFGILWHGHDGLSGASDEVIVAIVCFTQYMRIATLIKSTHDKTVFLFLGNYKRSKKSSI